MNTTTPTTTPTAPPAPASAARRTGWHRLTITRKEQLTEDAVAVTLAVPPDLVAVFAAAPGRHVVVRHRPPGRELRRTYSVCPPPDDPGALRLVIQRNTPDGFGAHARTALRAGDTLELAPPTGTFGLLPIPGAHHVLIAGGSGITPLAAMAAAALRDDPGCRVSLVHAARTAGTALLADELAGLKDAFVDRFTALYVLSREQRPSDLFGGRVDAARLRRLLTLLGARPDRSTTFSLCGPWGLVETARTTLTAWGAPADHIRWELFSADGAPRDPDPVAQDPVAPDPAAPGTAGPDPATAGTATPGTVTGSARVRAVIGGRTTTVTTAPGDRVVLDAVLRARPEVPYACRDGVCGSCRALVVSGEVTLGRQHALDPRDLAAGYTLACRARPASDDLTLDFDA